jgi:hypothetical protein
LAGGVDGEVAGDAEEPGLEAGGAVVGGAAFEDAEPGALDEVVDEVAAAEEMGEVAGEAVLV